MVHDERPDPDAMLRRVQAETRRDQRAKLKLFFGFAPGVGKTFRMLQVARELAAHGIDVVVGVVETHGRKETAALAEGLEVLSRRKLTYRGRTLEEFDLDAALAAERLGALAVFPKEARSWNADQRSFFEAFCRQASFAFDRARLSRRAREAALRVKTEELRNALLSAVSHDLRTPLAAITGAATSLRDDSGLPSATRSDLLESICEEAERLERLVANLLDMTRLEAGGLSPKREWVPLDEIVGAALTRLEAKLKGRVVTTTIHEDVPLLSVDPVLMQQLFVNLLENTSKYSSPGSALEIEARLMEAEVLIEVRDQGPGLGEDAERIFEKFYRRAHAGVAGVGLGLPICRGIVEAHGGTLTADNRSCGGAVLRIRFQLAAGAPTTEPESNQ